MHRNAGGALASLTANYTDSEGSDIEDDGEHHHHAILRPHNPTFVTSPVESVSHTVSVQEDYFNITGKAQQLVGDDGDDIDAVHSDSDRSEADHTRQESKDLLIDDIEIPAEPVSRCANHLQEKFTQYYDRMLREGLDMTATIQNQKQFRNPSIYEKLIQFCQIDELGTNYSPDVYDPGKFLNGPFYEELAKLQKAEMDKRMKEQKDKTKIEFVTGTAKKSSSGDDDVKKRKSKWDIGAVHGPTSVTSLAKPSTVVAQPPGLVPVSTVASGTKAMVISAFGTIAKKSKQ